MAQETQEANVLNNVLPLAVGIVLTVKAAVLFRLASGGNSPTIQEIDDNTKITVGNTSRDYGQRKDDFITNVKRGTRVTWSSGLDQPNGNDKDYKIILKQITQKKISGNTEFFANMPLNANNNEIEGTVQATIADHKVDDYNITFHIQNPRGELSTLIVLDPKLRLDPRRLTDLLAS